MRYAHQPLSEIDSMTVEDIFMWAEETVDLLSLENATSPRED